MDTKRKLESVPDSSTKKSKKVEPLKTAADTTDESTTLPTQQVVTIDSEEDEDTEELNDCEFYASSDEYPLTQRSCPTPTPLPNENLEGECDTTTAEQEAAKK